MSPTAAAFALTSAPHSCPGAAAIPRGPTPAAGPKEQQQPPALPDFKLIQIPGEDDPSAFFFAPENFDGFFTFDGKERKKRLTSLFLSRSKKKKTTN